MLRIPNRQNPLPPLYCTEFSVQKIPYKDFFLAPLFSLYYNLILDTCIHISTERNRRKDKTMKRVGFLTSGGDCQALNATMRGVAKGLYQIYKDEVKLSDLKTAIKV